MNGINAFGKREARGRINVKRTRVFVMRMVDEEPIEFICNENQQFRRRIKID